MSSPQLAPAVTAASRRPSRSHALMHALMLITTICWASNIVAGKEALTGFGPMALAQLRVLGAGVIYVVLFLVRGRWSRLRLSRREWMLIFLVALNGITLNQICFIGGLARTTVAHAGLIVALGPIMVLVLACVMRMETLTALKFGGMLISFAGVGVLTAEKAGTGGGHWAGDLILLAGSAVFAYYTILMKEVANRLDGVTLNALTFGIGAVLMLPVSVPSLLSVRWQTLPPTAVWGLAYIITLGSVFPYLVFAYVLTELAASRVAAFNYLQPVIATALGIWMLGEVLTVKVVLGGGLILLGVYLTERERGEDQVVEGSARSAA